MVKRRCIEIIQKNTNCLNGLYLVYFIIFLLFLIGKVLLKQMIVLFIIHEKLLLNFYFLQYRILIKYNLIYVLYSYLLKGFTS